MLIEWKMVLERRPAAYAEIVGGHRLGNRDAARTNRDAREFPKRFLTDAALAGEKERKEAVGNLAEDGGEEDRRA